MNLVDDITPIERFGLKLFARDFQYQADGALAPAVLRGFMKAMSPQQLLAAAIQEGTLLVVDANQFITVVGNDTPRRYDRVITDIRRFTVEAWWGAPELPPHSFFKMRLIGGQQ